MLSRICYALQVCWKNRQQLCKFTCDPDLQLETILDLTRSTLDKRGIKALILDFDGVLASHAELQPRSEVVEWLHRFADYPIFILSNKPMQQRIAYFRANFPQAHFIIAARPKPYPDGINEIIRLSNIGSKQLLMVDDRLATGIVAAITAGVPALWITHPYIDLATRPIRESWFILLRWLERMGCKLS